MTHANTRRVAGVATALVLLITACGDDKNNAAESAPPRDEATPAETAGGAPESNAGGNSISAGDDQAPESAPVPGVIGDPSRKLIITMTVGVEVTDAADAVDLVIALARRHGGQLYDSQLDLSNPRTASGDLVFKLPPDEVESFISGLDPAIGRRTGLDGTTSDVTTQIADLDAQILAAEASVDRIRVLLEGATTLDDVIRLEIEFTDRQTHLEQLRAQQNTLNGLVALATVTVHLTTAPPVAVNEGVHDIHRTIDAKGIGPAFEEGWEAFLSVLVALALFLGYTAPFLVLGAIALWIALKVAKRATRGRSAVPAAPSVVDHPKHPTPVG